MKFDFKRLFILPMVLFMVACSTPYSASSDETTGEKTGDMRDKTPAIEIDALGLDVSVPDRFAVLYKSNEDMLVLSERLYPLRRIVVKRMEPMPVGEIKPYDYYPQTAFGAVQTVEGLNVYPYFVARGENVIEGGLVLGGDKDAPVAIFIETETGAKREPLYAIVRAMKWRFPDTDSARYRKDLMRASTDNEAVKREYEKLLTFAKVHPDAADAALMDFSDYLYEAIKRAPSSFLGDKIKTVRRQDGREELDRIDYFIRNKTVFSETLQKDLTRMEDILHDRMNPDMFLDERDWDMYIERYQKLYESFSKDPSTHYMESIIEKEIREAHRLFILGIKDPYIARVAYSHYVQNYPDSIYREIIYEIFMRFDAHDRDYATKRKELYEKWERENIGTFE